MNKSTMGVIQMFAGVIGLGVVYSIRPPFGFGQALMMWGQGRHQYIREPVYEILLAICAVTSFLGLMKIVTGQKEPK